MYNNLVNKELEECLDYILSVLTNDRLFDKMYLTKEFDDFTLTFASTGAVNFSVSVFKPNGINVSEELENYIMKLWKAKFQASLNKQNEIEV
jgi:hypothetical protein